VIAVNWQIYKKLPFRQLFAPPQTLLPMPQQKNYSYNCDMFFFWVSTICAQILRFSRVSTTF